MPVAVETDLERTPATEGVDSRIWEPVAVSGELLERLVAVRAVAQSVEYVRLNPEALTGKSSALMRPGVGRLPMALPEGSQVIGLVERTMSTGPDAFLSEGTIEGVSGATWRLASVRGRVSASITGLPGGEVKVRTIATGDGLVAQLYRVDPKLAGDCVVVSTADRPFLAEAQPTDWGAAIVPDTARIEALSSGEAVIDLLVVYTSAVRAALGGAAGVDAEAMLAVAQVNADFELNGITARIRLSGTLEVELPGDAQSSGISGWQRTALENMTGTTDGIMDDVHDARAATGADLVTLVVQRPDPSSAGLAYILERVGHYSEPFFAFSVVNYDGFSDSTTLTHELGHNLGCAHDLANAGSLPARGYHGAYPGAYGFRVSGNDTAGNRREVRSIMAYSPGTRLRYFSSPDRQVTSYTSGSQTITYAAPVTLGQAVAPGVAGADNASVIRRAAFQVSGYRLASERSFAGRLVNVSTRAYVGTGYKTLTGGFVVAGPGTKRVLLRAPGPSIGAAPYNVPGALTDSILRVTAIGVGLAGENDDWGLPASRAVDVAAAGQKVGAFPFANGSRDAALLLDLAPGSYTAEVTGAGGAEGVALIEAYDVNAAEGPRLVNLSTRAYASTETPIVAGFVVQADSGAADERKTMFLRVRGPSLANYGLPADEVMPDPVIEIYNDRAQLVFVNDDWDSPSAIISSLIPMIERGKVDQASEAAVFAAAGRVGPTDMLPVEPGAVIELPPGLYTMFVRPFTDDTDPVGEPGVAIVEVFEMNE